MFDLILNPFVTVLTLFYSIFNQNIIVAIVVLTIIIRTLTYPLLAKQQQSSQKMQELQPKLKKLQEKYKNDREKLSQVQMELYREHGVNPLGGCLPLLVQFPVLIGLYQAIFFALAATPFQLVDLSERLLIPGLDNLIPLQNTWLGMNLALPPTDNPPYALVLPLLVMGTTWLQSKYSMGTAAKKTDDKDDEKGGQAQMMTQSMTTIMPLMFGFFALSFSVGLSVYFITSNLIGIVQYSPWGKKMLGRIFNRSSDQVAGEIEGITDKSDHSSSNKSRKKSKASS